MTRSIKKLKAEVKQALFALHALANLLSKDGKNTGFGDWFDGFGDCKRVGINYSIEACEIVAEMTGYDRTLCKMMNFAFRCAATKWMFERALAEVC